MRIQLHSDTPRLQPPVAKAPCLGTHFFSRGEGAASVTEFERDTAFYRDALMLVIMSQAQLIRKDSPQAVVLTVSGEPLQLDQQYIGIHQGKLCLFGTTERSRGTYIAHEMSGEDIERMQTLSFPTAPAGIRNRQQDLNVGLIPVDVFASESECYAGIKRHKYAQATAELFLFGGLCATLGAVMNNVGIQAVTCLAVVCGRLLASPGQSQHWNIFGYLLGQMTAIALVVGIAPELMTKSIYDNPLIAAIAGGASYILGISAYRRCIMWLHMKAWKIDSSR